MRNIPSTDVFVHPLCLGGNVFGWTADEAESFAVLDAYADAGGNFVDTADGYSQWVPGHRGGESEEIIGRWMAARGNRDAIVLATKVGSKSDRKGLAADNVRTATEESLQRLQTDRIDLLYTHRDDEVTAPEETLGALDELVREGKVRHIAASNVSPERLEAAMDASEREGLVRYVALQPHYNLVERDYENGLADVCRRHDLGCLPYFALAMGFLTGKYRPGADAVDSQRAQGAGAYLDARGERVLAALDAVAAAHGVPVAAVSLAWLAAQPTVVAPIASARTPGAAGRADGDGRPRAERRRAARAGRGERVGQRSRRTAAPSASTRDLGRGEHLVGLARAGAQAREAERAVGARQHDVAGPPAGDHGARGDEHDLGEGVDQGGRLAAREPARAARRSRSSGARRRRAGRGAPRAGTRWSSGARGRRGRRRRR